MGTTWSCCQPEEKFEFTAKIVVTAPAISRASRTIRHDITHQIDGDYEFNFSSKGVLASSSSGTVYKAKHKRNSTYHAVKQLEKDKFHGKDWQEDVEALLMLDHPHICRIFEVWEDNNHVYLVMELCGGGDLTTYANIKTLQKSHEVAVSLLVRQMAGAVAHFHSGGRSDGTANPLMHGDLRLENWLFARPTINIRSPLELDVKMIDFGIVQTHDEAKSKKSPRNRKSNKTSPQVSARGGISKLASPRLSGRASVNKASPRLSGRASVNQPASPRLSGRGALNQASPRLSARKNSVVGGSDRRGACCQAPEQVESGSQALTQQVDVWALGVITFFLLSGQAPFQGLNNNLRNDKIKEGKFDFEPTDVWKSISLKCKDFVKACLRRDPRERPRSIDLLGMDWMLQAKTGFDREFTKEIELEGADGKKAKTCMFSSMSKKEEEVEEQKGKQIMSISDAPLPSAKELVNDFKKKHKLNTFEKAVMATAAHRLPVNSIRHLQHQFQRLDLNGDGVLSAEEIYNEVKKTGIDQHELVEILKDSDTDGSGAIEYTEFIASAYDFQRRLQDSVIWSVFRSFDHDHSGQVSKRELLHMLKGGKFDCEEKSVFSTQSLEDLFGEDVFEDALSKLDKNKDGTMDFNEFKKVFKRSR